MEMRIRKKEELELNYSALYHEIGRTTEELFACTDPERKKVLKRKERILRRMKQRNGTVLLEMAKHELDGAEAV